MLKPFYLGGLLESGCDEAGRGCLAGPVFAAAVILPSGYHNPLINDSKQLNRKNREVLRIEIENKAVAWAVAVSSVEEIDKINILNASFLAIHRAIDKLGIIPQHLIIDGNRFNRYKNIPHTCIIKGDSKYLSIAAASILAKTYRDRFMQDLAEQFPGYCWDQNKGYPTKSHKMAIMKNGFTSWHRRSFHLSDPQLKLKLETIL